jgi:Tol biopolymer transport system component
MRAALIFAAVFALVSAAPARASLVYERGTSSLSVWIANDDGSGARRLVTGSDPLITPDGQHVLFTTGRDGDHPELNLVPAAGGAATPILKDVTFGVLTVSPDSRYALATSGPLDGPRSLNLIDLTTGGSRVVATGFFTGASFSPNSLELVYSMAAHDSVTGWNLFRTTTDVSPSPFQITHDGLSQYPVWGPRHIAYTRIKRRGKVETTGNLALIDEDGGNARALTHDHVGRFLFGLVPIDWSADGTRLLANFGGQDTSYIVTVDPATGKEHVIGKKSSGYEAVALTADGNTILGTNGGPIFGRNYKVLSVPYAGGAFKTLGSGQSPSWSR